MTFPTASILGVRVAATSLPAVTEHLANIAKGRATHSYVCATNVHMIMEAYDDPEFKAIVNNATLAVPDGSPVAWMVKALTHRHASRVRGPDLMLALCKRSAQANLKVGLYGGSERVLLDLAERLRSRFANLDIAFAESPPFRELTREETEATVARINTSGCHVLFVGLGCPKQERFMARVSPRCHALMIGVGAAFDFHAGHVREAPRVMQALGLEWAFRLIQQPARLWRRYLIQNPRFVILASLQLLGLLGDSMVSSRSAD